MGRSDEAFTPHWLFQDMEIEFDLDVAAPTGGVPWVPATNWIDKAANGLVQPWEGRVWMNPPFSQAYLWVPKFISHGHGVSLLPHTKSDWHYLIWREADGIVVPNIRVDFVSADGLRIENRYQIFLAAFGLECVDALSNLGVVRINMDSD